eukprot:360778_1
MQHQSRQTNRNLRNPYTKKSGSSRLRLLSTLFLICLVLISILYVLATHAFLNNINNDKNNESGLIHEIIETTPSSDGKEKVEVMDTSNIAAAAAEAKKQAPVIAYAISLTSCAETPSLIDGAAVLKHSIHLSSIQNPNSNSQYDYQMYAIVHHNAKSCQPLMDKLGYKTMLVDVPVPVNDIQ